MTSRSLLLLSRLILAGVALTLVACASPIQPRQAAEGLPGQTVVLTTPYGPPTSRAASIAYQSTVLPQNLESVIDHFEVTLQSTSSLPNRPSQTIGWAEARRFTFERVPAGTWTVLADAFDASNRLVARGVYPSGVVVADGAVTSVPSSIQVAPVRSTAGATSGDFSLTLREVPAHVTSYVVSLQSVTVAANGTFTLTNVVADYPVEVSLSSTPGLPQVATFEGADLPTGSYVLGIEFHGGNVGDLKSTFSPVFTVEIYGNLTSTLDVSLNNSMLSPSVSSPTSVNVAVDANGKAIVSWNGALGTVSHIQVALAKDSAKTVQPTSGDLQLLATVPNINAVRNWLTDIRVSEQTNGAARFWVRYVASGIVASEWTSTYVTSAQLQKDYYVSTTGSDSNPGTRNQPYLTLQRALDQAQINGVTSRLNTIHMTAGTYEVSQTVVNQLRNVDGKGGDEVPVPVSIMGGWDPSFSTRNPRSTPSVLEDTRSSVSGQQAVLLMDQGSEAFGLTQVIDGLQVLANINSGSGTVQGIVLRNAVEITLNDLDIDLQGSNGTTVEGIRIEPWQGTEKARWMTVSNSTITLRSVANTASTSMKGIALINAMAYPNLTFEIFNNIIDLGPTTGLTSAALYDNASTDNDNLYFYNNTVVTSVDGLSTGLAPIALLRTGNIVIENNLIFNKIPSHGFAIYSVSSSAFTSIRHNILEGFTEQSVKVNLTEYTPEEFGIVFTEDTADNVEAAVGDTDFVSAAGENYRVKKARHGGLTQVPVYASSTEDYDGVERTLPWTAGAFEVTTTKFLFTTAGKTGRFGPDQNQINAAYTGTSLEGAVVSTINNGTGGIQKWLVPTSGKYRVELFGAQGAAYDQHWGRGAAIKGDIDLNANDTLWILVGQTGEYGAGGMDELGVGGGGGGTFIGRGTDLATSTPLLVAGGGGASGSAGNNPLSHASVTETGNSGSNSDANSYNNEGGSNGDAGDEGYNGVTSEFVIDKAAGWFGFGTTSQAFTTGGAGAEGHTGRQGGGGFGGGGGHYNSGKNDSGLAYAGGGGGYSGGGPSDGASGSMAWGGGGGSYTGSIATQTTAQGGAHAGPGLVVITRLP